MGLIYLFVAVILIYIGPIRTFLVKSQIKKNPVRIVISFATTPYRIDTIKPVLDSIFKQSIKPNQVYLNIPFKSKVYDNKEYIIPTWLKHYPNVIINQIATDYGPATKLIPTLKREQDPNTIIITIDDDMVYPKHMLRDLVRWYLPGSYSSDYIANAAITGIGQNILFVPSFDDIPRYDLYVNGVVFGGDPSLMVIGMGGVAYKRKFFKEDIFSLLEGLPTSCFLSDDLMISAYLHANYIDIIKLSDVSYNPIFSELLFRSLPTSLTSDALQMDANNKGMGSTPLNYGHCLAILPKYDKTNYQEVYCKQVI